MTRFGSFIATTLLVACGAMPRADAQEFYDGPKWPDIPSGEASPIDYEGPRWPNLRFDDVEPSRVNPRPSFADPEQVEARIMGRAPDSDGAKRHPASLASTGRDANASADPRWPNLPPENPPPPPFKFEAGMRYWYSSGRMNFGFANGNLLFGNPTSTLDWKGLSAHSGEVFGRVTHVPTGVYVKGLVGLGTAVGGEIIDRDFFANQIKFSDTTSDVKDGNLKFAMFDIGWAYAPAPGMRLGFFAGYHYWEEEVTAYGLVCNQVSPLGCTFPGELLVGFNTATLRYQPTWHAMRLGFETKTAFADRWTFTAEVAGVPYASLKNKDSHLLRQSFNDLGPAPNVIADSRYAFGIEAEVFFNYAVTPNIEIGAGARYWGLTSHRGDVTFGPSFNTSNSLNRFDQQRYGLLLQVKGRF